MERRRPAKGERGPVLHAPDTEPGSVTQGESTVYEKERRARRKDGSPHDRTMSMWGVTADGVSRRRSACVVSMA